MCFYIINLVDDNTGSSASINDDFSLRFGIGYGERADMTAMVNRSAFDNAVIGSLFAISFLQGFK